MRTGLGQWCFTECSDIIYKGTNYRRQNHAKEDANNYAKWTTAGQCSSLDAVWFTSKPLPGIDNKSASPLHQVEGKNERMTFLRALLSGGKKKNGSSFCFKSSRVEINHVRKIPLKHPSQTSTDHSGIYLSLAVYFLSPQKQSATSALFHHSTAPCTGQLWRTAVEEEMHSWCAQVMEPSAGTCKEEHPPHWHVSGTEQPGKR